MKVPKKVWRLVKKYGETYAELRYENGEWCDWLFPVSKTPKKYWVYVEELGLYVRNTSIK